jgi:hypothetical protein
MGLLTLSLSASSQYAPPSAGLVGWWRGDGNADDSVGGHNGILENGMGFTNGLFGQAFVGGTNKRVYIPDDPAFHLSSFSIGTWININANSYTVFSRNSSEWSPYGLTGNFDGTIGLFINVDQGTPQEVLRAPITYNQWHQVTGTFDAALGKMSIYIDGNPAAQKTTTATPLLNLTPSGETGLGIGNGLNSDFPMLGEIEEVVLYSRALSPAEVTTLAAGPCPPRRATASAQLVNHFVVGATVTDGGCGYFSVPQVLIQGGGGTGATATAVVSNSVVTGIVITDAGIGYTSTPSVYIYSPLGRPTIEVLKAIKPSFTDLLIGRNYQLQVSADMNTWTNQGSVFAATNTSMVYPQYTDVENWDRLFFRLQTVP